VTVLAFKNEQRHCNTPNRSTLRHKTTQLNGTRQPATWQENPL
jgi:hypothetical protein